MTTHWADAPPVAATDIAALRRAIAPHIMIVEDWQPMPALPPDPPPRKSRRELRAERAVLKARRKARKGSIRR